MVFGPLSFGRLSQKVRSLETGLKPYLFQSLHLPQFLNLLMQAYKSGFWSIVSSARSFLHWHLPWAFLFLLAIFLLLIGSRAGGRRNILFIAFHTPNELYEFDPVEIVPESARSIQQRHFFYPGRLPMGSIFLYPVHLSNNIFGFRLLATSS